MSEKELSSSAKTILHILDNNSDWCSSNHISKLTGFSCTTVKVAIRLLKKDGVIEKKLNTKDMRIPVYRIKVSNGQKD